MTRIFKTILLLCALLCFIFAISSCGEEPRSTHPERQNIDTLAYSMPQALRVVPGTSWARWNSGDSIITNGFALMSQDAGNSKERIVTDSAVLAWLVAVLPDSFALSGYADTLRLSNDTLYISGQNYVLLSDYLDNTDAQTLSFSNPNLSISGGNSVDLSALSGGSWGGGITGFEVVDSVLYIYSNPDSFDLNDYILVRENSAVYKVLSDSIAGYENDSTAVIEVGSNFAVLQPQSGMYDVKWFGATGDGTTDDVGAIDKAVAFTDSMHTLFFPNGIYFVTDPIDINKRIHIKGSDRYLSVIRGDTALIGTYPQVMNINDCNNSTIENLGFSGHIFSGDLSPGYNRLRINRSSGLTLRNLFFNNTHDCITLDSVQHVLIENIESRTNDEGIITFFGDGNHNIIVDGLLGYGVGEVVDVNCDSLANVTISNVVAYSNGSSGDEAFDVENVHDLTINNASLYNFYQGINIKTSVTSAFTYNANRNIVISNCNFHDFTYRGIVISLPQPATRFAQTGSVIITGCVFDSDSTFSPNDAVGIDIRGRNEGVQYDDIEIVQISDCVFKTQSGIRFADAVKHVKINNNRFDVANYGIYSESFTERYDNIDIVGNDFVTGLTTIYFNTDSVYRLSIHDNDIVSSAAAINLSVTPQMQWVDITNNRIRCNGYGAYFDTGKQINFSNNRIYTTGTETSVRAENIYDLTVKNNIIDSANNSAIFIRYSSNTYLDQSEFNILNDISGNRIALTGSFDWGIYFRLNTGVSGNYYGGRFDDNYIINRGSSNTGIEFVITAGTLDKVQAINNQIAAFATTNTFKYSALGANSVIEPNNVLDGTWDVYREDIWSGTSKTLSPRSLNYQVNLFMSTIGADYTVTLPAISSVRLGTRIRFVLIPESTSHNLIINGNGASMFDDDGLSTTSNVTISASTKKIVDVSSVNRFSTRYWVIQEF